jgi:YVTN family beta-propeller protein
MLPTGMSITPTAAKGSIFEPLNPGLPDLPQFVADHPVSTAVSPDGSTLLILTSGFNRNFDAKGTRVATQSNEYVFVYDIRRERPVQMQALQVPDAFAGLAWNPSSKQFYVSGGVDDNVHVFERAGSQWKEVLKPIALGHGAGLGVKIRPEVSGLAVNAGGTRLLATNYENDSVSLIDLKSMKKIGELDLRPGKSDPKQHGVPGGEFPYWVAFKGDNKAYVSCVRDREIAVLDLHATPVVTQRIKTTGQPNRLLLNKSQSLLFAAADNSDSVVVIDTSTNHVVANIKTTAPDVVFPNHEAFKGSSPNSLALSPDEQTLYVTNGGTNSVAVIRLEKDADDSRVVGLIPTGWNPSSISLNRDGSVFYVTNARSNAGANPKGCRMSLTPDRMCSAANQYILQLVKGGLLVIPRPTESELAGLTAQVAANNHFPSAQTVPPDPIFAFLRSQIKHVIYVVKENRTYDQVLGDLEKGNGDPSLALFKEPITPNHHELARRFVTLDNFFCSGEVSGDGWNWSTAARATDYTEKTIAVNYAARGFSYDYEGSNRNINVSVGSPAERTALDPRNASIAEAEDLLPGTGDVAAPDGPGKDDVGAGYLWNSALRAGLKVRNYGFFLDLDRYSAAKDPTAAVPLEHDPAAAKLRVAFTSHPALHQITDLYFRGFDQRFPDYWRYKEWEREFDDFVKNGNLPELELFRIDHDHFGDFLEAIDGVNTVEKEMADNDYALGLLAEKIAHSPYAKDTLIFAIEDDAQNGPDHVDAHRSIAYVIGPYVKQGAVVSTRFNTVSMLRTIEEVLGIKPMGLNDALQSPMSDVFSKETAAWSYSARVPAVLRSTQLPLPPGAEPKAGSPGEAATGHDAAYWAGKTAGFDFSSEDKLDSERFNLVLWNGLKGDQPYPTERDGRDLRKNREKLLERLEGKPPAR